MKGSLGQTVMRKRSSYVLEKIDGLNENQANLDDLLYEAVERNCKESVLALLNGTFGMSDGFLIGQQTDGNSGAATCKRWKKKLNVKAVILAATKGSYELIKIFLSYGFHIEQPHDILCRCNACKHDPLGSTKARVATFSALSNPVWISLSSEDPFSTIFSLNRKLARLQRLEESYENAFSAMRLQVQTYCMDLFDCIETSTEQYKIVNMVEYDDYNDDEILKGHWSLKLLNLAFRHKLKKVVAHPVIQHVVTSLVYDSVPTWRLGGSTRRFFYVIMNSLMFPFTALAYMFFPYSSLGRSSQAPLVKFINGASSFVTFLGLLALMAALPANGLRTGKMPSLIEWVVFIWIISLLVAELTQLTQVGWYRYFTSGWNLMDVFMIVFMLTSFSVWTVILFIQTPENQSTMQTVRRLANGLFTCGTIMSFFRLVYLCQITRFLGLLQLCLGKMIEVIFQFAFISCVVLWSFSVGMVFLHNTLHVGGQVHSTHIGAQNKSEVQVFLSKGFNGLLTTVVTLAWASLNMVGLSSLEDFDDGGVVYLWSSFLFTLYYGVSMIVLLNMLIAMMSNSYQQIENNIEVEHKYAKTQLWFDYIIIEGFQPCPFNLIPTWHFLKKLVKWMTRRSKAVKFRQNHNKESEYKKTAKVLVKRYLLKKHKIDLEATVKGPRVSAPQNADFIARVQNFIDQMRPKGLPQRMPSFEDSGLDISFSGDQILHES